MLARVHVCVFACQRNIIVPVPKRLRNAGSCVRRAHCRVRETPIESREFIVIFFILRRDEGVSSPQAA